MNFKIYKKYRFNLIKKTFIQKELINPYKKLERLKHSQNKRISKAILKHKNKETNRDLIE